MLALEYSKPRVVLPFKSPTTIVFSGPTMSGKTRLCHAILKQAFQMFEDQPDKIIYAYGQYQPSFDDMKKTIPGLILHEGYHQKIKSIIGVRFPIILYWCLTT